MVAMAAKTKASFLSCHVTSATAELDGTKASR